jgi:hypothetical protein
MKPDMTSLQILVTALDRDRPLTAPPALIRIFGPVGDPERIEENIAFDELIGFAAPSDCSAVGVVASGWATSLAGRPEALAEPANRGACDGERQRVRTTVIVERDGTALARVRWSSGRVMDEAPTSGRIFDCLRRAVGLATEPPPIGTDVFFASMWLTDLADAVRQSDSAIGWSDIVALHPVAQFMAGEAPRAGSWLVDASSALAVACPWSEIRRLITTGAWAESPVTASAASWMDDGMLCRWLCDGQAPLALQLDHAVRGLSPKLARRVRATLSELGLATGAHQYL